MAKAKPAYPHVEKAMQYIDDVLSGRIDVCKYVKLAAQRHLDDLKKSEDPDYPYYFDQAKSERVCRFVEMMIHTKGKWARTPLVLAPWQCFATVVVFGWMKRANHKRRFRKTYIEVPRKNGKSAWSAAVGNYMLTADGELGAEVYSGAASEKQAWEVFGPARLMAKWNEDYAEDFGLTIGAKNISILFTGSKFEPLIGDPGDGASPHLAIVDEFHEHKKPNLHDTMSTGMGSREQPLMWVITTAGVDVSGPCYAERETAIKVLEGVIDNPEIFPLIYTIDENDDWKDFEVWKKANPNYGISLFEDYLRSKHREAMQSAEKQNINRCKHLNVWSNAAVGWINMVKWGACGNSILKIEDFAEFNCWIGFDFASYLDLTAIITLFRIPPTGKFAEFLNADYALFGQYYLPEETIELPENAHFRAWRDQGFLLSEPGSRMSFPFIHDELKKIAGRHDLLELSPVGQRRQGMRIREIAYDPSLRIERLMEDYVAPWADFPCVEVVQRSGNFSGPMKEFEALYMSGKIKHDNNPLLNWQASNVILKNLGAKTYYPAKERAANKIDGIVAAIMALSRAMTWTDPRSVYETRGFLEI